MTIKRLIIYADGASRGNPGPAAIGAIIKDEQGKTITSISRRIGATTNNQGGRGKVRLGAGGKTN